MKITTYQCDLCKEVKPKQELHQLYWDSAKIPQSYTLLPSDSQDHCDRHICKTCVDIIKKS